MYQLIVATIALILIIICILTATSQPQHEILSSDVALTPNNQDLRDHALLPFTDSIVKVPHGNNALAMYNMSVRKTDDGFFGVIRGSSCDGCRSFNRQPLFSYVYQIQLDNNADIIDTSLVNLDYSELNLCNKKFSKTNANGIEDPKLFTYHGEDWVIANVLGSKQQKYPCVNTMCYFKLSDPQGTYKLIIPPDEVSPEQRQKNWCPFEYNGKLYCEYSLEPHVILEIDVDSGKSHIVSGKINKAIESGNSKRCGAPAILIGNYWIGIGHTRMGTLDYTHFFYSFENKEPFEIKAMTEQFKLDSYSRIQFAAGLSEHNGKIYVSYGINDCENRIAIFETERVLTMLFESVYNPVCLVCVPN